MITIERYAHLVGGLPDGCAHEDGVVDADLPELRRSQSLHHRRQRAYRRRARPTRPSPSWRSPPAALTTSLHAVAPRRDRPAGPDEGHDVKARAYTIPTDAARSRRDADLGCHHHGCRHRRRRRRPGARLDLRGRRRRSMSSRISLRRVVTGGDTTEEIPGWPRRWSGPAATSAGPAWPPAPSPPSTSRSGTSRRACSASR